MKHISRAVALVLCSLITIQAHANPIVTEIPEPTTLSLISIGLIGLGLARRKVKSTDKAGTQ